MQPGYAIGPCQAITRASVLKDESLLFAVGQIRLKIASPKICTPDVATKLRGWSRGLRKTDGGEGSGETAAATLYELVCMQGPSTAAKHQPTIKGADEMWEWKGREGLDHTPEESH